MYLKGVYFSLTYPNGNGPCRRVDDQQINIDLSKIHPGAYDMLAGTLPGLFFEISMFFATPELLPTLAPSKIAVSD